MMRDHIAIACAAALLALAAVPPASAETLAELAKRTHFHGIAVTSAGTAKLLLASHHGLFAVDENGQATLVSPVQDFMGFSPNPADALSYYASGHPATGGNLGFIKSSDGGASWTQVSQGLDGPVDFHQLDVSPADPLTVYGVYGALQVSRDGGKSWIAVGEPPGGLISIAASSLGANRVFAAAKTGLYVSEDAGKNWALAQFESEIVSLVESGTNGTLHAFVLGRGFMKANETDIGSWTALANDFGERIPLHLAVDPQNENALYMTTQDNAVLASGDGGLTWKPFSSQ
jgi:photosystem II stability/assembly factor-like uncharacterized protein